jgi:signal transduction histidine kinase
MLLGISVESRAATHTPLEVAGDVAQPIGLRMQLFYDPSGRMPLAEIVAADAAGRFSAAKVDIPSFGHLAGATWVRFDLHNPGAQRELRWLHANWPLQESYTLFLVRPGGAVQVMRNGGEVPIAERPLASRHVLFPVELDSGESMRVYLRESGRAGMVLDLSLWPPARLLDALGMRTLTRSLGMGVTLIVAVFAFFAWRTHRRFGLLYIAPAQIFLIFFLIGYEGFLLDFLPSGSSMALVRATHACGMLSLLFHILFAREFLRLRDRSPLADDFMRVLAAISLGLAVAQGFTDFPLGINLLAIVLVSAITLVAILASWHGDANARGFVAAWGLLWLGTIVHSVQILGWAGLSYVRDLPFFFLIASVLVISYILYRDLKQACDQAELAQTRLLEKEKDAHEQLIQAVEQRTVELSLALERAESANRAKSVFLSSMSHELRTPLHNVLGYTTLLKKTSVDEARRQLDVIERSGRYLLYLIDDILQYARNDTSPTALSVEPMLLADLCMQLAEHGHMMAQQQGNRFEVECDPDLPDCVEADIHRLRQVLLNLLSNACKYTRNGLVRLRVVSDPQSRQVTADGGVLRQVCFMVEDTGCGIEQDDLGRIFEPFVRVHALSDQPGVGLGLAIARQWATLMGARIEVSSEVGCGSHFHFTLSLAEIVTPKELALPQPNVLPQDALVEGRGLTQTILLVEADDSRNLWLAGALGEWGLRSVRRTTALDASRVCRRRVAPIDAVILDVLAPKETAWQVLRVLRDPAIGREIPIILIGELPPRPAEFPVYLEFDLVLSPQIESAHLQQALRPFLECAASGEICDSGRDAASDQMPPYDELQAMRELLESGRLTALKRYADGLAASHPECADFALKVRALAVSVDFPGLQQLLGKMSGSAAGAV